MKNKLPPHPLGAKIDRLSELLEQLLAVEMYKGGAGQREIASSLDMSVGKINRLVKGVSAPKKSND